VQHSRFCLRFQAIQAGMACQMAPYRAMGARHGHSPVACDALARSDCLDTEPDECVGGGPVLRKYSRGDGFQMVMMMQAAETWSATTQ
jgi:hypothetical protein